jgi:hypothetical protein
MNEGEAPWGAVEEGYWHGKHDEIHGESAGSDP